MEIYDAIEHLKEMLKATHIGMFTTVSEDGSLQSRPMIAQDTEFRGYLWFFTNDSSGKVDQIDHERQVNIALVDTKVNRYVSVSGTACLVTDPDKLKELWSSGLILHYPKGLDEPGLALIKVTVSSIAWWEGASTFVGRIVSVIKAWADKDPSALGEAGAASV